ncbi:MAG: anti-sigma factor antagonist [Spartobacteria bacterium]|nr:anti-sigma factor antagonist [Spartobacteria bacterium]
MTSSQAKQEQLFASICGSAAYITVKQRGSFRVGHILKQFAVAAIDANVTTLIFDMQECKGLDSTFMGVLAGLSGRAGKSGGRVILIHVSPHINALLSTLGLDTLVQIHLQNEVPNEIRRIIPACDQQLNEIKGETSQLDSSRTMLDAHQTLVEMIPENLAKFKDVLELMKADMARHSSGK